MRGSPFFECSRRSTMRAAVRFTSGQPNVLTLPFRQPERCANRTTSWRSASSLATTRSDAAGSRKPCRGGASFNSSIVGATLKRFWRTARRNAIPTRNLPANFATSLSADAHMETCRTCRRANRRRALFAGSCVCQSGRNGKVKSIVSVVGLNPDLNLSPPISGFSWLR